MASPIAEPNGDPVKIRWKFSARLCKGFVGILIGLLLIAPGFGEVFDYLFWPLVSPTAPTVSIPRIALLLLAGTLVVGASVYFLAYKEPDSK